MSSYKVHEGLCRSTDQNLSLHLPSSLQAGKLDPWFVHHILLFIPCCQFCFFYAFAQTLSFFYFFFFKQMSSPCWDVAMMFCSAHKWNIIAYTYPIVVRTEACPQSVSIQGQAETMNEPLYWLKVEKRTSVSGQWRHHISARLCSRLLRIKLLLTSSLLVNCVHMLTTI